MERKARSPEVFYLLGVKLSNNPERNVTIFEAHPPPKMITIYHGRALHNFTHTIDTKIEYLERDQIGRSGKIKAYAQIYPFRSTFTVIKDLPYEEKMTILQEIMPQREKLPLKGGGIIFPKLRRKRSRK